MSERVNTPQAPAAIGPYSQGVRAGDTVYVSGQLGLDPASGELREGLEAQARQALANVRSILNAAGLDLCNVVKTTCLLADIGDFQAFNAVYAEAFKGSAVLPARSAFAVKSLPKGALVELEAIAVGRNQG